MQQGYSGEYGQPQVQVDRSVLGDLKGYQPPPMFGTAPSPVVETEQPQRKVAPPETPTLTTPKAEDILSHPVENLHVLTEQNPQLTAPVAPAPAATTMQPKPDNNPLLPMPEAEKAASKTKTTKLPPLPKHKPKFAAAKTEQSTPPVTKQPPVIVPTPAIPKTPEPKPVEKIKDAAPIIPPVIAPNAYHPKTPKTMPAVPPIHVEKNELPPVISPALPALPPTTDNMMEHSKPTIGERIMDAALARHIESDPDTIKEKLKETQVKSVIPKSAPASKTMPSNENSNALIFAAGETDVSPSLEAKIKSAILPRLAKDDRARIQILSFATSPDGTESGARRISLSRALSVRDYLLAQKINPSRIDVRALANQGSETPQDRVDIVLLK